MSEKKPPMSGPMTPERLAEIRDSLAVMRNEAPGDVPTVAEKLLDADIPDLFAEVERLREEKADAEELRALWASKFVIADCERTMTARKIAKLRDWQKRAVSHLLSWHTHGWTKGMEAESVDKLIAEAEGL